LLCAETYSFISWHVLSFLLIVLTYLECFSLLHQYRVQIIINIQTLIKRRPLKRLTLKPKKKDCDKNY
jgi:hypothetical protein